MSLIQLYISVSRTGPKFLLGFHSKIIIQQIFLAKRQISNSIQVTQKLPATMKLLSAEFQSIITEDVKFLHELFKQNGFDIRIAGGAVRDLLLGMVPKDLDFATTATPEEMRDIFNKKEIRMINLKGESHGTVTTRINDKNYEITTLRIDKETDGRHALVEFTKNWYLDASRRDLTINAMFLDLDGTVYDYFNGIEDLKQSRIVFVGDATQRIREDYLRILRYFRFHGRISKSHEHDEMTLASIASNASGLAKVAGERIQAELYNITTGNNGIELLKKIISLGVGEYIGLPASCNFSELNRVSDIIQKHRFVMSPVTILSALLETESDVDKFKSRMKPSAYHRDLAYFIVEQRNRRTREPVRYYQKLSIFSKNTNLMKSAIKEYLMYMGETDILKEFEEWPDIPFPLTGHDIMSKGQVYEDRRLVGAVRKELQSVWVNSNFTLTREELKNLIPEVRAKCASHVKTSKTKPKEYQRSF